MPFVDSVTGKPIKGVEVTIPFADGVYRGFTNSDGEVDKWEKIEDINERDQYTIHGDQKYQERRKLMTQAYCFKCRAKKEVKDPKPVVLKNGRRATQGVCPDCGTKMFRIGK